jgi:hypothetical protein
LSHKREAEIAALKKQEVATVRKAFEADYAKYETARQLGGDGYLSKDELATVWQKLCGNWSVAGAGTEPGNLGWDDETGKVFVFSGLDIRTTGTHGDGRQEAAPAGAGRGLVLDLGSGVTMEFVWIAALKGWVESYEVTNQEYRRFKSDHNSGESGGQTLDGSRQPVVNVSYDDAVEFARWLTVTAAGQIPEGHTVRLPDGDEWMTLAQCGDGREYSWGSEWPPKYGNYDDEKRRDVGKLDGWTDGCPVTCLVELSGKLAFKPRVTPSWPDPVAGPSRGRPD